MEEYIGSYNPKTGLITYNGQEYTLIEYRYLICQDTIRQTVYDLNEERDTSSDVLNLPGNKPYFVDNWNFGLQPRIKPTGLPRDQDIQ